MVPNRHFCVLLVFILSPIRCAHDAGERAHRHRVAGSLRPRENSRSSTDIYSSLATPLPLIVFLHIPKAAGTSMKRMLETFVVPAAPREAPNTCIYDCRFLEMTAEEQDQIFLIGGHRGYGVHLQPEFHLPLYLAKESLPLRIGGEGGEFEADVVRIREDASLSDEYDTRVRVVKYFTVLREPLARTISQYFFARGQAMIALLPDRPINDRPRRRKKRWKANNENEGGGGGGGRAGQKRTLLNKRQQRKLRLQARAEKRRARREEKMQSTFREWFLHFKEKNKHNSGWNAYSNPMTFQLAHYWDPSLKTFDYPPSISSKINYNATRRDLPLHRPMGLVDLELAKQHLDSFAAVGIAERLSETAEILNYAFGWSLPTSRVVTANSRDTALQKRIEKAKTWQRGDDSGSAAPSPMPRPHRETISQEDRQMVLDANTLDVDLYKYAVALFEKQLAAVREAKNGTSP